jgi:hypothetical protein
MEGTPFERVSRLSFGWFCISWLCEFRGFLETLQGNAPKHTYQILKSKFSVSNPVKYCIVKKVMLRLLDMPQSELLDETAPNTYVYTLLN